MKRAFAICLIPVAGAALWACSGDSASPQVTTPDASSPPAEPPGAPDASVSEASSPAQIDSGLTGKCADTFGDKLTVGFGRIDGVVYAVQTPDQKTCTMPNSDHVIIQVLMNGAVYRLVTNVQSTQGDPKVQYLAKPHAMPAPAFAEGWHTGLTLDYAMDIGVHSGDFTPYVMGDLVAKIVSEVKVGDKISIYGISGDGRPESAHDIHRTTTKPNNDGAIVVDPTGSPSFLLFHFDEQTF